MFDPREKNLSGKIQVLLAHKSTNCGAYLPCFFSTLFVSVFAHSIENFYIFGIVSAKSLFSKSTIEENHKTSAGCWFYFLVFVVGVVVGVVRNPVWIYVCAYELCDAIQHSL